MARKRPEYDVEDVPYEMARQAELAQSGVNLAGIVGTLNGFMADLWTMAYERGQGTDWVNQHPVVVLMVTQLGHLSGVCPMGDPEVYGEALSLIRAALLR